MNPEKFTELALQTVQAAQSSAQTRGHSQILPAHVLLAALEAQDSPAARAVELAGRDVRAVKASLETFLGKLPKISGDAASGQYVAQDTAKGFEKAEKTDRKSVV